MTLDVVILAAGQGTRMRSAKPKVLHPLAGKPMVRHVIDTAMGLGADRLHVVIGHGAQQVRDSLAECPLQFAEQTEQKGTGHAVAQALDGLGDGKVLVLYGDVPLIRRDTLSALLDAVDERRMALLTVALADPTGYGRIKRNARGEAAAIVEHKDASEAERAIT
ncbi:NTP transferase domain-containing protein, partial [Modicisalibacter luteus]